MPGSSGRGRGALCRRLAAAMGLSCRIALAAAAVSQPQPSCQHFPGLSDQPGFREGAQGSPAFVCRLAAAAARRSVFAGDALWLPNTSRPAWLDGSLPGDRGFDPLGLSKPVEYLQVDVSEGFKMRLAKHL